MIPDREFQLNFLFNKFGQIRFSSGQFGINSVDFQTNFDKREEFRKTLNLKIEVKFEPFPEISVKFLFKINSDKFGKFR